MRCLSFGHDELVILSLKVIGKDFTAWVSHLHTVATFGLHGCGVVEERHLALIRGQVHHGSIGLQVWHVGTTGLLVDMRDRGVVIGLGFLLLGHTALRWVLILPCGLGLLLQLYDSVVQA